MKMIKPFYLAALMIVFSLDAYAEPIVQPLSKGEVALFDGTLFNPEAVATIEVEKDFAEKACAIQIESESARVTASLMGEIELGEFKLQNTINTYNDRLALRDQEITELSKELKKQSSQGRTAPFIIGFVTGTVIVTSASLTYGYVAGQIN